MSNARTIDSAASATAAAPLVPTLNQAPDFAGQATRAKRVVDRLGGDGAATIALLLAAELGYSGPQILNGAEAALQPDGTITNQSPAGSPLGRIDVSSTAASNAFSSKATKRPTTRHLAAAKQADDGKILIDKLRGLAQGALAPQEETTQIGLGGTHFILELLNRGLSPEQVIDSLVLGLFFYELLGTCYTQSFPLSTTPPVERACDGADSATGSEPAESEESEPIDRGAPLDATAPQGAAVYQGDLASLELSESDLVVTILPDGTVTGELTATEELDNYVASVDVICGLFADDEEAVAEECSDALDDCAATVLWYSDLAGLQFVGDAPDTGVVSGTISITWDTTPHGCGEPSTEIQPLEISATVSPNGAQITVPFEIDLERVESPA